MELQRGRPEAEGTGSGSGGGSWDKPKYLGMPTAAYQIGGFTVTREGSLVLDDSADSGKAKEVLVALAAAGFEWESRDGGKEPDNAPQGKNLGLTVEVPLDQVNVGNLTRLLDAKGSLFKKALGVDNLPIEVMDEKVCFPWFNRVDEDSAAAYTHFISALCEMSRNAKRVTATEKAVDNEKYAFRCFLLRLGFIGAEYKAERKILLKNLSGSSAFKNGGAEHEISQ